MAKTDLPRILIIDDEKPLRRVLKATLRSEGYRIFEAANGQTGLESAVTTHPDVIILDLALPDKDGLEILQEIRRRTTKPIIILSVREQEKEKVAALDAGADDYLTKPFSAPELLARLRAVIRRLGPATNEKVFKNRDLIFDIQKRVVLVKDAPVHLTPTEYDVLKTLIQKAGKVVTRREFFQEIWNKEEGAGGIDHLLRVTISNLRNKIEPDPARPTYILTEPAVGYRLSLVV